MRLLSFCLLYTLILPCFAAAQEARTLRFTYELLPLEFPSDQAVDIYIPLPANLPEQRILEQSLESSVPGEVGAEMAHGNTYYHLHRPAGSDTPLSATLSWIVEREPMSASGRHELAPDEKARYLSPNKLVPVGHEVLQPVLAEVHAMRADDTPASTARAIYDWVVDNVEYKKVGTGWGNGDTFWACSERYGNCTDFHSLFIALARSEGIPARFEIGFPVPMERQSGEIGGYHCWVQFYLPDRGWVPIDASEASKHPRMREQLYGGQPADRILFTTGRDLVLSESSRAAPLNYFIYPYVEVDGKAWAHQVPTRFSYQDIAANP